MIEKVRPLNEHVLIRRLPDNERTPGGIIIPDVAREKQERGEVLAVGEGRVAMDGTRIPASCKPGDVVLFRKHEGHEIKVQAEDLLILNEGAVLGVVDHG